MVHGQVLLFIIVPDNHNNKHVHSHTHIYREVYISTRITHINLEHVKVIGYVSSSKRYKFTSRLSCDTPPSQKVPARQQLFAIHYSHHHQCDNLPHSHDSKPPFTPPQPLLTHTLQASRQDALSHWCSRTNNKRRRLCPTRIFCQRTKSLSANTPHLLA